MNNIFTEGPLVYIFTRNEDKELIKQRITNFKPYFYVHDEDAGSYPTFFGDRARKIVVDAPYDVVQQRKMYKRTYEADIHYPNRFLIDHYKGRIIPSVPLRKQFIDIEINSTVLPDPMHPKYPVVSITVWDSFENKYFQFGWGECKEPTLVDCGDVSIATLSDEQQMFDVFLDFEKAMFPDILMAWNGDGFDFPYLFNRIGIERMKEISPLKKAGKIEYKGYDNKERYYIAGMTLMDFMYMYKHVTHASGQRESYALNFIGQYELKKGKLHTDMSIGEILKDRKKLLQYNKRDVEIMVGVDEKLKITEYFNSIRRITKSTFNDVFANSRVVDNLILSFAKDRFVLPTRQKGIITGDYVGGFIRDPELGLHEWVGDFDATALYPNIIRTFNISPETLDDNGEININDVRFRKEPIGIFPEVCAYMMQERNRLKREMMKHKVGTAEYDALDLLQQSTKFLVNSVYGYSAFPGSRLYEPKVASSITYMGRAFVKWVGAHAKNRLLYGDTDSVFIRFQADNLKDCIQEGEEFQKMINGELDSFVSKYAQLDKHYLELKFEKIFERIFFGGKKRYTGELVWKEGKEVHLDDPEVRGYEIRRSDSPQIAKEFQKELFRLILDDKPKKDIDNFIADCAHAIRRATPLDLGFPVSLKSFSSYSKKHTPIHVRAAKYSVKYDIDEFVPGEKIKYIFIQEVPRGQEVTDVIAFKDKFPKGYTIDYERIIERIISMKVRPIYQALGWMVNHSKRRVKIKMRTLS